MRSSQRHKATDKAMECKKTKALRDGTKYETTVIVVQRNPKDIKMAGDMAGPVRTVLQNESKY